MEVVILNMHPSKVIIDPIIKDSYCDKDLNKLYQYIKLGDYPAEWFNTSQEEDMIKVYEYINRNEIKIFTQSSFYRRFDRF